MGVLDVGGADMFFYSGVLFSQWQDKERPGKLVVDAVLHACWWSYDKRRLELAFITHSLAFPPQELLLAHVFPSCLSMDWWMKDEGAFGSLLSRPFPWTPSKCPTSLGRLMNEAMDFPSKTVDVISSVSTLVSWLPFSRLSPPLHLLSPTTLLLLSFSSCYLESFQEKLNLVDTPAWCGRACTCVFPAGMLSRSVA